LISLVDLYVAIHFLRPQNLVVSDVWGDLRENQTFMHSLHELSTTHRGAETKSKDDTHGYVSIVTIDHHHSLPLPSHTDSSNDIESFHANKKLKLEKYGH